MEWQTLQTQNGTSSLWICYPGHGKPNRRRRNQRRNEGCGGKILGDDLKSGAIDIRGERKVSCKSGERPQMHGIKTSNRGDRET